MKKISKKEITKIVRESITKTLEQLELKKPSRNAKKFLDKVAKTISRELQAEVKSAKKKMAKAEKAINKKLAKEEKLARKKISKAEKIIRKKILNAEINDGKSKTVNNGKSENKPVVNLTKALPKKKSTRKTTVKKKTAKKKTKPASN